ncbi:hypothetical protein TNCV_272051 [Trichonephila clavipes]|nr:hypothetical protein TNCV_272051 [Trichonephila clavipes]
MRSEKVTPPSEFKGLDWKLMGFLISFHLWNFFVLQIWSLRGQLPLKDQWKLTLHKFVRKSAGVGGAPAVTNELWTKTFPQRNAVNFIIMSGKKRIKLHEALDLLQNLPSKISDVLADDFSAEEAIANNLH